MTRLGTAFPIEGWHHCHRIPGCCCPPCLLVASRGSPRPPVPASPWPDSPELLHACPRRCPLRCPRDVPSPPDLQPPLPFAAPASLQPRPAGCIPQDAASPPSPPCPLHPCCVPSVPRNLGAPGTELLLSCAHGVKKQSKEPNSKEFNPKCHCLMCSLWERGELRQ